MLLAFIAALAPAALPQLPTCAAGLDAARPCQRQTSVSLTVGTDGKVKRCRVAKSSGDTKTDEATCKIVTQHSRFKPALDPYGYPVESEVRPAPIVWRLEK